MAHSGRSKWLTPYPVETTVWGAADHTSAFTLRSFGPAGLCTFFKIIFGEKLFFVSGRVGMPILRTKDETRWQVAVLKRGEHVFIPPGIIHFDITIEDAFIVGGYFYNFECAPQTLEAIVCEHFFTDEE